MLNIIKVSPETGLWHFAIEWNRTLKAEAFIFVRRQMTTTCPTVFRLILPERPANGNCEIRATLRANEQNAAWAAHAFFILSNTFKVMYLHGTPYPSFEPKETPPAYVYEGKAFIELRKETECLD